MARKLIKELKDAEPLWVSLVDRPANRETRFRILKRAGEPAGEAGDMGQELTEAQKTALAERLVARKGAINRLLAAIGRKVQGDFESANDAETGDEAAFAATSTGGGDGIGGAADHFAVDADGDVDATQPPGNMPRFMQFSDGPLKPRPAPQVHTVVFDAQKHTMAQAMQWAEKHGLEVLKAEEVAGAIQAKAVGAFDAEAYRTEDVGDGITAVYAVGTQKMVKKVGNRFVVMRGSKIVGNYATKEEALAHKSECPTCAQKSDAGPYGNVEYADAVNKKYPVDSEQHVRAAWSYIHQAKNRSGYSAAELQRIESKIVKAWKDKIDSAGPPSAASKRDLGDAIERAVKAGNIEGLAAHFADEPHPYSACAAEMESKGYGADEIATICGKVKALVGSGSVKPERSGKRALLDKALETALASVSADGRLDVEKAEAVLKEALVAVVGEEDGMEAKDIAVKLDIIDKGLAALTTRLEAVEKQGGKKPPPDAEDAAEGDEPMKKIASSLDAIAQKVDGLGTRLEKVEKTSLVRKGSAETGTLERGRSGGVFDSALLGALGARRRRVVGE